MNRVSMVLMMATLVLAGRPAFATVIGYQTAVQSESSLINHWGFDGATDTARLTDSQGAVVLGEVAYGDPAPSVGMNVAGFDATSRAVETKRASDDSSGAGLRTPGSAVTLGSTMTLEGVFKPTTLPADGSVGFVFAGPANVKRGYFLLQGDGNTGTSGLLSTEVGNSWNNVQTVKSSYALNHWLYYAETVSTGGTNSVINAWIADLTAGETSLTKVLDNVTVAGQYVTDALAFNIGVGPSDNSAFPGLVDEVSLYNANLSDAAIQSHFDAITVPEPATLTMFATGVIGLLAYAWRKRR